MNNTVTQVIVCLAGLAIIAACCVYMVNAGRQSKQMEIIQLWEATKDKYVDEKTRALQEELKEYKKAELEPIGSGSQPEMQFDTSVTN